MKILHIGKYFPPYMGGMETYLRSVMTSLSRKGVINLALVHRSEISIRSHKELYNAGGQTLLISRTAVWCRFLFTPVSPTFPWVLNSLIKRQQPDVLHLHMPNVSAFWALFVPRARRIPWIIQWQSDVLASAHNRGLRLFYRVYQPFERAMLKRARWVITSSPPYLESSRPLREFRAKCSVIPLGLDPCYMSHPALAPEPSCSEEKGSAPLQVLAVGRLTYYKGFEYLIRAAATLEDVQVHLVGKGEEEIALKALANQLGVGQKVVFHGPLPEEQLARLFTRTDCVCLPSIERTEAFGLVLLEAMYYGKATVIADVPGSGMSWIVDDGITGIKTPSGNITELAAALQSLSTNRDKLHALGRNGKSKFDRCFHIDRSAGELIRLYSRVLDQN